MCRRASPHTLQAHSLDDFRAPPALLGGLTKLYASNCGLVSLGAAGGLLSAVRFLYLDGNRLQEAELRRLLGEAWRQLGGGPGPLQRLRCILSYHSAPCDHPAITDRWSGHKPVGGAGHRRLPRLHAWPAVRAAGAVWQRTGALPGTPGLRQRPAAAAGCPLTRRWWGGGGGGHPVRAS